MWSATRPPRLPVRAARAVSMRLAHSAHCQLGGSQLELRTGHMARFADAAVVASTGDNAVLATCVHKAGGEADMVPLTVDFRQSAAAVGRIPTNYLRRELGQTDADILAGRLIDRSLRPMLHPAWRNDTQVMIKPLSLDDEGDGVLLGLNAAASGLLLSSVPLLAPVAGVRVAIVDKQIVLNPPRSALRESTLDMVLSGSKDKKTVMIEMEGHEVPLEILSAALDEGLAGIERLLSAMEELSICAGKEKATMKTPTANAGLEAKIRNLSQERIEYVLTDCTHDKVSRDDAIKAIEADVLRSLGEEDFAEVKRMYRDITKENLRRLAVDSGVRCDGRTETEFRPISIEVDVYKKLHGSALFQRGQTQVLSTVTFDSPAAAFHPDSVSQLLGAQQKKTFMLHYEFPAFATNEIGSARAANRRELGHGALAEKALNKVIPKDFPYSIRVSSQVLESNGSSSMASACSGSLALLDAGVPLKAPVAGVAIGLVTDPADPENKYRILTDILGIEDYAGDMDFKIAGTANGLTAMQLDIKIGGLTRRQLDEAVHRGEHGIGYVLERMGAAIGRPREEFKETVPVLENMALEHYKRALLFRNGGLMAKTVEAETRVKISPDDETHVSLVAPSKEKMDIAKKMIQELLNEGAPDEFNFGQLLNAEVAELVDRGALVRLRPGGRSYLVPNAALSSTPIRHPSAAGIQVGQRIVVQWLGRDAHSGQVRLSRRLAGSAGAVSAAPQRK